MIAPKTRRYSLTLIVVHWVMALLIGAAYLTSEGGRQVRANPPHLHFWLGFSVLILLVPRIIARLLGGAPPMENSRAQWLDFAAKVGHWILYGLILFVPLSGWYAASRLGVDLNYLGLHVPPIAPATEGAPGMLAELHQVAGNALLILAGLHGVIAIWHQFILRDGTLQRMSPL